LNLIITFCYLSIEAITDEHVSAAQKRMIIMVGTYLNLCFGASLKGNEGLYLEGSSLVSMIKMGTSIEEAEKGTRHFYTPLLGRFKTETGKDKDVIISEVWAM
jgi:hypothetical protein